VGNRLAMPVLFVTGICLLSAVSNTLRSSDAKNSREHFVGAWKLVSAVETLKDGSSRNYIDVGPNGKGYLIYSADGHMCANLMRADRAMWKDAFHPTDAEKIAAFDSFSSYCGKYEVNEATHVMTHLPETSSFPDYVGTRKKRPYVLQDDTLTFADDETDPEVKSYKIVWQKAKD
jgi:hypothetical protein